MASASRKLILFDFDGTIADSFSTFLEFAGKEGFRFDAEKIDQLRDLSMREAILMVGLPVWKLPIAARKFHRYFAVESPKVRLIDGIKEAIIALHSDGCALGIVTTNDTANVKTVLAREGLSADFDSINSERSIFGKARTLKRIVRDLGIDPSTVWYVGDEVRDIEAAREAGLRSLSVTWGFNSAKALRLARPDHIVSHPDELIDILVR